jgi:hypothetical protein
MSNSRPREDQMFFAEQLCDSKNIWTDQREKKWRKKKGTNGKNIIVVWKENGDNAHKRKAETATVFWLNQKTICRWEKVIQSKISPEESSFVVRRCENDNPTRLIITERDYIGQGCLVRSSRVPSKQLTQDPDRV